MQEINNYILIYKAEKCEVLWKGTQEQYIQLPKDKKNQGTLRAVYLHAENVDEYIKRFEHQLGLINESKLEEASAIEKELKLLENKALGDLERQDLSVLNRVLGGSIF